MSGRQGESRDPLRFGPRAEEVMAPPAETGPLRHGDLPPRPTYKPEEGAPRGSEVWPLLGSLAMVVAVVLAIGWAISQLFY